VLATLLLEVDLLEVLATLLLEVVLLEVLEHDYPAVHSSNRETSPC